MYIAKFNPTFKFPNILKINNLFQLRVYWAKYKPRDKATQCYRCQAYGHGQRNCNQKPNCLKCGKDHSTEDCQKSKDLPPTCALCQGEHLSNSKKCPKFKEYIDKISKRKITKNHTTTPPAFSQEDFPPLISKDHTPAQPRQDTYKEIDELKETLNDIKSSPYLKEAINEFKQLAAIFKTANKQERRNAMLNFLAEE